MSLLLYFFLACIIAGAYQWYCHHRDKTERYKRAEAEILRNYEPEFFEPLALTPILTSDERVLLRGLLTISVVQYYPRSQARDSIIPVAHEAIALWALSLAKSGDGPRPESYTALKRILTG